MLIYFLFVCINWLNFNCCVLFSIFFVVLRKIIILYFCKWIFLKMEVFFVVFIWKLCFFFKVIIVVFFLLILLCLKFFVLENISIFMKCFLVKRILKVINLSNFSMFKMIIVFFMLFLICKFDIIINKFFYFVKWI